MAVRETDIKVAFEINSGPLTDLNNKIDKMVQKVSGKMGTAESKINKTASSFSNVTDKVKKVTGETQKASTQITKATSMFNRWGQATQNAVTKVTTLDAKVTTVMNRTSANIYKVAQKFKTIGTSAQSVASKIGTPFDKVKNKVKDTTNNVKFFASSITKAVSNSNSLNKVSSVFQKIKGSVEKTVSSVKKLPSSFKNVNSASASASKKGSSGMSNLTSSIFKANAALGILSSGFSALGDTIKNSFKDAMDLEQTQLALDALVGDAGKSQKLFNMLNEKGMKSVFSEQDFLTGGKALLPLTKDLKTLEKGMNVMERLAMSNMEQGMEGATFSMREYLSDDYTSIVERFNLPRSMVKQSLKGANTIEKKMDALDKLLQKMGFTDEYVKKVNTSTGAVVDNIISNIKMKFTKSARTFLEKLKDPLMKFQEWIESGALDKVFDSINKAIEKVADVALKMFDWIANNGETVKGVLLGIGVAITAVVVPALYSMAMALLTNPITWVVLGIVALVTALYKAYNNSEKFRNSVNTLWGKLKSLWDVVSTVALAFFNNDEALSKLLKKYPELFKMVANAQTKFNIFKGELISTFNEIKNKVVEVFQTYLKPAIENFKNAFIQLKDTLVNAWNNNIKPVVEQLGSRFMEIWNNNLKPFISTFIEGFGKIMLNISILWNQVLAPFFNWLVEKFNTYVLPTIQTLGNVFATVIGFLIDRIGNVWEAFSGLIEFLTGVFTGDWEKAWSGIKTIFSAIWDSLKGIVQGVINVIIDIVNGCIRKLNTISVDIPDWSPIGAGKKFGFNLGEISHVQFEKGTKGAYNTPDTYIAGENGPELITGMSNKKVYTANETAGMLGNSENNVYNITINVQGGDNPVQTAKSVRQELEEFFASFARRNPRVKEV